MIKLIKFIKTIYIIGLCLIIITAGYGEIIKGAKSVAIGGVESVTVEDPNSLFNNSALMCDIQPYTFLFSYIPIYNIENMYSFRTALILPFVKKFTLGLGLDYLGVTGLYSQSSLLFSTAVRFNKYIYSGVTVKYFMNKIYKSPDEIDTINDKVNRISFDIGMFIKMNKYISLGVTGRNMNDPDLRFLRESKIRKSIRSFLTGIKFDFTKNLSIFLEEKFAKDSNPSFRFGTEFLFYKVVAVRAGMGENQMISLGLGLNFPYVTLNFGLMAHSELGNLYQLDFILKY